MKTLTLKQQYASIISEGIKEYEFRTLKTDLQGNILWTTSVSNENGSYVVQKKDNTLITNGINSNGDLFYVVIDLENGNIILKADSK